MKRILSGFAALVFSAGLAFAVLQGTPTPIVPPNETGEDSLHQGEVFNMARIKPGMGTGTAAVSASAAALTINNGAGKITLTSATAGASGATPTVVTLTNNKIQAADLVFCEVDQTGATAGSVPGCNARANAGSATLTIYNASVTAMTASTIVVTFFTLTSGNPN